jgi:biotin operon repressor
MSNPNDFNHVLSVLARLHRIADMLKGGHRITTTHIAKEEEISRRTVRRTIQFLRDSLGWEIESDHRGYLFVSVGTPLLRTPNRHPTPTPRTTEL